MIFYFIIFIIHGIRPFLTLSYSYNYFKIPSFIFRCSEKTEFYNHKLNCLYEYWQTKRVQNIARKCLFEVIITKLSQLFAGSRDAAGMSFFVVKLQVSENIQSFETN